MLTIWMIFSLIFFRNLKTKYPSSILIDHNLLFISSLWIVLCVQTTLEALVNKHVDFPCWIWKDSSHLWLLLKWSQALVLLFGPCCYCQNHVFNCCFSLSFGYLLFTTILTISMSWQIFGLTSFQRPFFIEMVLILNFQTTLLLDPSNLLKLLTIIIIVVLFIPFEQILQSFVSSQKEKSYQIAIYQN